MAELQVFSVYDTKAAAYFPPFFLPKQAQAVRAFQQCVNDPKHQWGAFPQDYTLFLIGLFDDDTGQLQCLAPRSLGNGLEHLKKMEDNNLDMFGDADQEQPTESEQ